MKVIGNQHGQQQLPVANTYDYDRYYDSDACSHRYEFTSIRPSVRLCLYKPESLNP